MTLSSDLLAKLFPKKSKNFLKLICGYKNYHWGKIGQNSPVYHLLMHQNIKNLKEDDFYAEM